MYNEIFADRLKKARLMNGFTQKDVENETSISQSRIAKFETGRNEPDLKTIGILAEFYGVSIDWLFGLGRQGRNPNYYDEMGITTEKTQKIAN